MGDDQAEFAVLHALRCIGFASEERVATAAGMPVQETTAHLRMLLKKGLVESTSGPFGGWGVTDSGRRSDMASLEEELRATGAHDRVRLDYESFLRLNPVLLQICTAWQMRKLGDTAILNDHTDADYDAGVLSRLMRIDDTAQEICADLATHSPRFGVYARRLSAALDAVMAGKHAQLADALESYHNIWFQLHEDLLTTLGLTREDERRLTDGS
ncbi:MAG: transcriptional regulator [Acidimicrobiia bacterium]